MSLETIDNQPPKPAGQEANVLIYLLRRDLRVSDNPILSHLAENKETHGFTHLLPLYIIPAHQMEVSGFLASDALPSPYPEARSLVGKYWRCGPHRARFVAQSVWDVKGSLEALGSSLTIRIGSFADALDGVLSSLQKTPGVRVGGVWMTEEVAVEEKQDERAVQSVCERHGLSSTDNAGVKFWLDEKYLLDDRDVQLGEKLVDLPDVFTTYRKAQEPLSDRPRQPLARPTPGSLPPPPPESWSVAQTPSVFVPPTTYGEMEAGLLKPLTSLVPSLMQGAPPVAQVAAEGQLTAPRSAHPFQGGESHAHDRLRHILQSGSVLTFKDTRNGLASVDQSSKLSAFLALGCITARQIHAELRNFEQGNLPELATAKGYGQGESEGTSALRCELLWRDYMRLCTRKFQHSLFRITGFRGAAAASSSSSSLTPSASASPTPPPAAATTTTNTTDGSETGGAESSSSNPPKQNGSESQASERDTVTRIRWKTPDATVAEADQTPSPAEIRVILERFHKGSTGLGLIDASQRELLQTGYTSNRARQNVASFLTKHLGIDWRYGAEWYEMLLVDYDVASNWANWQYVAGVGNDPRGDARIFNPIMQALAYDPEGSYVRQWVPELRALSRPEHLFHACAAPVEDLERAGVSELSMVKDPVLRIHFSLDGKPRGLRRAPSTRRNRMSLPPMLPGSSSASSLASFLGNTTASTTTNNNNNNNSRANHHGRSAMDTANWRQGGEGLTSSPSGSWNTSRGMTPSSSHSTLSHFATASEILNGRGSRNGTNSGNSGGNNHNSGGNNNNSNNGFFRRNSHRVSGQNGPAGGGLTRSGSSNLRPLSRANTVHHPRPAGHGHATSVNGANTFGPPQPMHAAVPGAQLLNDINANFNHTLHAAYQLPRPWANPAAAAAAGHRGIPAAANNAAVHANGNLALGFPASGPSAAMGNLPALMNFLPHHQHHAAALPGGGASTPTANPGTTTTTTTNASTAPPSMPSMAALNMMAAVHASAQQANAGNHVSSSNTSSNSGSNANSPAAPTAKTLPTTTSTPSTSTSTPTATSSGPSTASSASASMIANASAQHFVPYHQQQQPQQGMPGLPGAYLVHPHAASHPPHASHPHAVHPHAHAALQQQAAVAAAAAAGYAPAPYYTMAGHPHHPGWVLAYPMPQAWPQ